MSIIRREAVNDRTVLRLLEAFDVGAQTLRASLPAGVEVPKVEPLKFHIISLKS